MVPVCNWHISRHSRGVLTTGHISSLSSVTSKLQQKFFCCVELVTLLNLLIKKKRHSWILVIQAHLPPETVPSILMHYTVPA